MAGGRLVPKYVERAAWGVYDAYVQWLDADDLDDLRDAVTALKLALFRAHAIRDAPGYVLTEYFGLPEPDENAVD